MTFNPLDDPIDFIELEGRRSPGLAVVTNSTSPRRWDERRGYALSGARVVFRGLGLARPIVTLRLLSTDDWDDWHGWRSLVKQPAPGRRLLAGLVFPKHALRQRPDDLADHRFSESFAFAGNDHLVA